MRSLLGVLNIFGSLLTWFALYFVLPIITALLYGELAPLRGFIAGAGIALLGGLLLRLATRRYRYDLKSRDAYLLVTSTVLLIAAVAAIPLLIDLPELSFTRAYFEAMSGLSTTGATVLSGLDRLPHSINLWRHALSWLGGMGIIVLAVAVLPLLGVGGMQLYRAGAPGPMKDAKLTPRIEQTAKLLWAVYAGLTVLCIASLKGAGMNWFDAVCHGFSALSLGGFSTYDASIGHFNSLRIELVLIVFQVLAALNFATHFLAWSQRGVRAYFHDAEAKAIIGVLAASCVGIAVFLCVRNTYADFPT